MHKVRKVYDDFSVVAGVKLKIVKCTVVVLAAAV